MNPKLFNLVTPSFFLLSSFFPSSVAIASLPTAPLLVAQNDVPQFFEQGRQQLATGQYKAAIATLERVLGMVREMGDRRSEGVVLGEIAGAYAQLGEYPKALNLFKQSLAIHREVGNAQGESLALNGMGFIADGRGDYAEALQFYEQALALQRSLGDRAQEANILNNIGAVYESLGQADRALQTYDRALTIAKSLGLQNEQGILLNNIGELHRTQKNFAQALQFYEQAAAIFQANGNQGAAGIVLMNMGTISYDRGQYEEALPLYERALAIHQATGNRVKEGTALVNIGAVYRHRQQFAESQRYFQQALDIQRETGDRRGEGIVLHNLGALARRRGQYAEAQQNLTAAIAIWESLREDLSDDQKISLFEIQADTYRILQQVLIAQNQIEQALVTAERARARALVELLASQKIQGEVATPTIADIKRVAAAQQATLVQYSIIDDELAGATRPERQESELYIWVVKPTGEVSFRSFDLKTLSKPLKELVLGARDRGLVAVRPVEGESTTSQMQELHRILIDPIADLLPADERDRVVFIPHKELLVVPFAALQDESERYLIDRHTLLIAPSIQVLQLTRKQKQGVGSPELGSGEALIVGNPTMPSVSLPTSVTRERLSSLPGAEAEAKAIAQLLGADVLAGDRATETAVKAKIENASLIHFATHGLLDYGEVRRQQPQEIPGALAFAPSAQDDGFLTASEILNLELSANLVVLSACDTGRGKITSDGIIGLSRSFISAGTPSLIVSLWAVPDAPTASLMQAFYRQLQQTEDKAQALRQAMLATKEKYSNPRDWAAFTLIGEAN